MAHGSGANSCVWPQCQDKARKTSRHRAPLGSDRRTPPPPEMGQWQSPTGQLNLNGAQVCKGTELMGSWDSPGLLPWRSGWGVTERVGVCAWDRPRVRADNTWESGGAGKVSRKPEMEAEGGTGKTRAGGLQTIPGTKAVANWGPANHHQARGVPQLGACKPAPGPRGSPSWGPANQLRARGVPQLGACKPAPGLRGTPAGGLQISSGPEGSPSYGPGARWQHPSLGPLSGAVCAPQASRAGRMRVRGCMSL